jgi:hypothetical protein
LGTFQLVGDTVDERLCQQITNSYECAQAIERDLLSKGVPEVARRGGQLVIRLTHADSATFRDSSTETASAVSYSYRGLLPSVPYHVIEVQYYEGGTYLLVNAATGRQTFSNGLPVPSPDGHYIAAANVDLEAEFSPTTLQVWRVDKDSLVLAWEHDFVPPGGASDSTWGPADITWTRATELAMAREYIMGERRGYAVLRLERDRWTLVER